MKLYYCTDCKQYYHPGPAGTSGDYLSREESVAVTLAGHYHTPVRCDPCLDKAVEEYRRSRGEEYNGSVGRHVLRHRRMADAAEVENVRE